MSIDNIFADRDNDDKHEKYKEKKKKKTLEDFCEKKKRIHFRAIVCNAYFELQNAIKELYEITNENVDAISKLEKKISIINNEVPETGKLVFSPYGISPSQLGFVYADESGVYLSPSEKGFISIDGLPHGTRITSVTCNSENGFVTAELTCELFRRNISDMSIEILSANVVSVDSSASGIVGTTNTAINFDSIDTENYSYNLSFVSNASLDMPIRDIVIEFTSS